MGEGTDAAEIGRRIREARIARGWTHEELARRMGVNWRTVQRWQTGRPPRVETLQRLADVLDVPRSALLGDGGGATLSELREQLAQLSDRLDRLTDTLETLTRERRSA